MDKDIQEADVYFEWIAECPECGESIIVDDVEIYADYQTWVCDKCQTEFKYRHPGAEA